LRQWVDEIGCQNLNVVYLNPNMKLVLSIFSMFDNKIQLC
jgi:hypothetical protein